MYLILALPQMVRGKKKNLQNQSLKPSKDVVTHMNLFLVYL